MTTNRLQTARLNGQLVETTEEELKNLGARLNQPAPAKSPSAAAAQGASPDAAKMAGSRLQKDAVIDVKPERQTLDQTKRVTAPVATQPDQAQAAFALRGLDDIDERVQAATNAKLAEQTAALQLNEARVNAHVKRDGLEPLLQQFAAATDPATARALQAQLANDYGILNPEEYLATSPDVLARQAKAIQLTAGDLELEHADDLDLVLGPGWRDLSIPEFQQRVTDARQANYARMDQLRAQLQALPPSSPQRQILLEELGRLGGLGVSGVEAQAASVVNSLDEAQRVKVGNQEFTVADLMKDETVSQLVADYLNPAGDPEFKAAVQAQQPGLASWIDQNAEALAQLTQKFRQQTAEFAELQQQQRDLVASTGLSKDAAAAALGVTDQAVVELSDFSANPIWQALQKPGIKGTLQSELNKNPALAQELLQMSPEGIEYAVNLFNRVQSDDLTTWWAGTIPSELILDPDAQDLYEELADLADIARQNPKLSETVLRDKFFRQAVLDGQVSPTVMAELSDDEWQRYRKALVEAEAIDTIDTMDDLLSFFFEMDTDQATVQDAYQQLADAWVVDPKSDAGRKYERLRDTLDTNWDGQINGQDFGALKAQLKAHTTPKLEEFATQDRQLAKRLANTDLAGFSGQHQALSTYLSDGRLSLSDLENMARVNPELLDKVVNAPQQFSSRSDVPLDRFVTIARSGYLDLPSSIRQKMDAAVVRGKVTPDEFLTLTTAEMDELKKVGVPGLSDQDIYHLQHQKAAAEADSLAPDPVGIAGYKLAIERGQVLAPDQVQALFDYSDHIATVAGRPDTHPTVKHFLDVRFGEIQALINKQNELAAKLEAEAAEAARQERVRQKRAEKKPSKNPIEKALEPKPPTEPQKGLEWIVEKATPIVSPVANMLIPKNKKKKWWQKI